MRDSTGPWEQITLSIENALGRPVRFISQQALGGGCINAATRLETTAGLYFVKLNTPEKIDMFSAEAQGLREIAETKTLRVPKPITNGTTPSAAFLVLEFLDLSGAGRYAASLGHTLAALHQVTQPTFGWIRNNTIGSTPQINTPTADWVSFWRTHRLGYQLELAAQDGLGRAAVARGEKLLTGLDALFDNYRPVASLLHGDLWSGNQAALADGSPVIFDPAVYYGDREADLAMTELFGGFPGNFYSAYREAWPLDPGYGVRKTLYNLYHVLNHYHLFGGGYGQQAARMIDSLLSETG